MRSDRSGKQTNEQMLIVTVTFIDKTLLRLHSMVRSCLCPAILLSFVTVTRSDVLAKFRKAFASFVIGASCNGLTEWKTADGRTFEEMATQREAVSL